MFSTSTYWLGSSNQRKLCCISKSTTKHQQKWDWNLDLCWVSYGYLIACLWISLLNTYIGIEVVHMWFSKAKIHTVFECGVINKIWRCSPISFEHVFFDPHLTTHQSDPKHGQKLDLKLNISSFSYGYWECMFVDFFYWILKSFHLCSLLSVEWLIISNTTSKHYTVMNVGTHSELPQDNIVLPCTCGTQRCHCNRKLKPDILYVIGHPYNNPPLVTPTPWLAI